MAFFPFLSPITHEKVCHLSQISLICRMVSICFIHVLVICLFIISSPNRLMPTALRFAQQEACNSITHGVTIMPRALARIHYFSYISLNFSTESMHSFTKRGFCFQPFSVMSAHSIGLCPSLAETIICFLVLFVISGIFSISVPSCCDYPCWQLDTDT